MSPEEGLPQKLRLRQSKHFQEAYQQKKCWVGQYMVMWLRSGEDANLRIGVVASKKVGKAVQRNRAKRLLREAWRKNRNVMHGPYDIVLVARREILHTSWSNIIVELKQLAQKAKIIKSTQHD